MGLLIHETMGCWKRNHSGLRYVIVSNLEVFWRASYCVTKCSFSAEDSISCDCLVMQRRKKIQEDQGFREQSTMLLTGLTTVIVINFNTFHATIKSRSARNAQMSGVSVNWKHGDAVFLPRMVRDVMPCVKNSRSVGDVHTYFQAE
jgi:hypothetical protein